jgi:Ribonuclease G/E
MKKTNNEYVTIHLPLLHIDTTENLQYDKVVEEYNELRKELFDNAPPERMLHELQDIMQAYITLLCVKLKTFCVDDREVSEKVSDLLEQANQDHRKKIERYKAERGWI